MKTKKARRLEAEDARRVQGVTAGLDAGSAAFMSRFATALLTETDCETAAIFRLVFDRRLAPATR